MTFRYVFRDLDENLITTLDTDQPLAHLAIGNNIVLKTAEYSPAKETWHRVEYVMVGVTSEASAIKHLVGVICSVQTTKSTTTGQGHTPNSYQDMGGLPKD